MHTMRDPCFWFSILLDLIPSIANKYIAETVNRGSLNLKPTGVKNRPVKIIGGYLQVQDRCQLNNIFPAASLTPHLNPLSPKLLGVSSCADRFCTNKKKNTPKVNLGHRNKTKQVKKKKKTTKHWGPNIMNSDLQLPTQYQLIKALPGVTFMVASTHEPINVVYHPFHCSAVVVVAACRH